MAALTCTRPLRDDNGDAVFNDRRPGVARNSLQATATTQTGMRLSWTLPSMRPSGSALLQRGPGGGGRGPGAKAAAARTTSAGSRSTCRRPTS